jgi:hypothetical protein
MSRTSAIFIAFIFSLQLCGSYCYYFFRNVQLHVNVLQRLEQTTCPEIITMAARDFHEKLVDEEEIRIGNKMFDVISVVTKGDSVTVTFVRDVEEEILIEFLNELVSGSSRQNDDQLPGHVVRIFELTFLPTRFSYAAEVRSAFSDFRVKNLQCPLDPNFSFDTPPPRV